MKPLPVLDRKPVSSTAATLGPLSPVPARSVDRVGLDAEALPYVNWYDKPYFRHTVCFGWGTADDVDYIETPNRRIGKFKSSDLQRLRDTVVQDDVVVVGHNANRYDLPLLNGVLIWHDFEPLPRVRAQDTMSDWKLGGAFRNSLKAQCARYGVQLKTGSPDWDEILAGDPAAWKQMREYNVNDVVCTLQLERALARAGLPCPITVWNPRKGAR